MPITRRAPATKAEPGPGGEGWQQSAQDREAAWSCRTARPAAVQVVRRRGLRGIDVSVDSDEADSAYAVWKRAPAPRPARSWAMTARSGVRADCDELRAAVAERSRASAALFAAARTKQQCAGARVLDGGGAALDVARRVAAVAVLGVAVVALLGVVEVPVGGAANRGRQALVERGRQPGATEDASHADASSTFSHTPLHASPRRRRARGSRAGSNAPRTSLTGRPTARRTSSAAAGWAPSSSSRRGGRVVTGWSRSNGLALICKRGAGAGDVLRKEARLLARIDHPNVVRTLQGRFRGTRISR